MILDNQVALVTGASRGIGAAIAKILAENGAKVVGTATTQAGADAINATLKGFGGMGLALDVNDAAQIDAVLENISKTYGDVSILVNNAGITRDTLLMRMKDEDWDAVIATNLTSIFKMSRAVLKPMMKARVGRIVNITSLVGHAGNAGQTNYGAAKAGITGFTKSFATEVGSRGITVNCVAPGFIDTDMVRELPEAYVEGLMKKIPVGRFGKPEEIAAAVLFLVSPSSAFITGETLHVNGGMYMA
jgi:3-oxoacyl-[acyl-carrier protein] reductase